MSIQERLAHLLFLAITIAALTLAAVVASGQEPTPEQRSLIEAYAQAYHLDPLLMVAIAKHESNFNSNAKGALGELGLFQLRPEFHPSVLPGDDRSNVAAAALYLAQLRTRCTTYYGPAFWLCFNTGPSRKIGGDPKDTAYYRHVITIYKEELSKQRARVTPYGR